MRRKPWMLFCLIKSLTKPALFAVNSHWARITCSITPHGQNENTLDQNKVRLLTHEIPSKEKYGFSQCHARHNINGCRYKFPSYPYPYPVKVPKIATVKEQIPAPEYGHSTNVTWPTRSLYCRCSSCSCLNPKWTRWKLCGIGYHIILKENVSIVMH